MAISTIIEAAENGILQNLISGWAKKLYETDASAYLFENDGNLELSRIVKSLTEYHVVLHYENRRRSASAILNIIIMTLSGEDGLVKAYGISKALCEAVERAPEEYGYEFRLKKGWEIRMDGEHQIFVRLKL